VYAKYDAVLLFFHDPNIQVHLFEYGLHDILDVLPVNLKIIQANIIPSRSIVTSSFANRSLQFLFSDGRV
jgi:hypothetical protein